MEEIYWIQRLDSFHGLFIALTIVSGVMLFGEFVEWLCVDDGIVKLKKLTKYTILLLFVSIVGLVFCPTTEQGYVIWGVGGTIDYMKQNKTLKELPDKAVKCLDLWVEKSIEKNENNNKNKKEE